MARLLVALCLAASVAPSLGAVPCMHDFIDCVSERDASWHFIVGDSVTDWATAIRARAAATTGAIAGRVIGLVIDASTTMLAGDPSNPRDIWSQARQLDRVKQLVEVLMDVSDFVVMVLFESYTSYWSDGKLITPTEGDRQTTANRACLKMVRDLATAKGWTHRLTAKWANRVLGVDFHTSAESIAQAIVARPNWPYDVVYTRDGDGAKSIMNLWPSPPWRASPGMGSYRDDPTAITISYRDEFLRCAGISWSVLILVLSLSFDDVLEKINAAISGGEVMFQFGRACQGLIASALVITTGGDFSAVFARRVEEAGADGATRRTGLFEATRTLSFSSANAAERTLIRQLDLVNRAIRVLAKSAAKRATFARNVVQERKVDRLARTGY